MVAPKDVDARILRGILYDYEVRPYSKDEFVSVTFRFGTHWTETWSRDYWMITGIIALVIFSGGAVISFVLALALSELVFVIISLLMLAGLCLLARLVIWSFQTH